MHVPRLVPNLVEIFEIRSRLAFPDRHQQTIRAQNIILIPDANVMVVLSANVFGPDWLRSRSATVTSLDSPGTRQGMVDRCDLIVKDIGIVPIGKNPLLDDGFAVGMERNAAAVVGVGDLDEAGLDRKRVVASGAIGVLPLADRVARVRALHVLR